MTRRTVIFVLSVVALAGSLTATLASVQMRDWSLRGYVDPTQTIDLPFQIPRFGVNADLFQYDDEMLTRQLDRMDQLGVLWVRQIVDQTKLSRGDGTYTWSTLDRIVRTMADYDDMNLVVVLIRSGDDTCANCVWTPPDDLEDYLTFVDALAARYATDIDYYQIWDEPNIRLAWGGNHPQVTRYAAMLSEAYDRIYQQDASAYVIAAALAPTTETGPQNLSDLLYLEQLYHLGIAEYSDAIAAKPYGFDHPPDDRRVTPDHLNFSRFVALREVMIAHGDQDKHLWASNFGWNTAAGSIWGQVTVEQQRIYTLDAFSRIAHEWPYAGGMILQEWQPDLPADDPRWGFALIDHDDQPTELYQTLQNADLSTQNQTSGLYPPQNAFATYQGTWSFSTLGADIGWLDDSRATFTFTGERVALVTRQADYVTNLYATIDGGPANALPQDINGNSFLLLKSDALTPELTPVIVADDLDHVTHELELVADELIPAEAQSRYPIVGYAVLLDDLAEPYNQQIRIGWIAVIVSALATVLTITASPFRAMNHRAVIFYNQWRAISQLMVTGVVSVALMLNMFLTWQDGIPQLLRRESVNLAFSIFTAGVLYWNSLPFFLTVLLIGTLFWLIYQRIEHGLLLVIFWAPFFLFPVELYQFAFPVAEVILWITILAWGIRMLAAIGRIQQTTIPLYRNRYVKLHRIDFIVIGLVLLGALALSWSERLSVALTDYRTLFIQPALFYLMIRTTIRDWHGYSRLIYALIASGFVVAIVGLVQWIQGDVITAEEGTRRLASVYGSPNNAGLLFGRIIPLLFTLILVSRLRQLRTILLVPGLATISLALLLTQSAGALFLGVPVGVIVVIFLVYRQRSVLPILGLILVGVIGLALAAQTPRFDRLTDLSSGTNFYRIRVWQSTAEILSDHPVTGLGLDQFLYDFRGEYIMPDAWEEPELSHPHNILLDFWVRFGLSGVIALFTLIALIALEIRRSLRTTIRDSLGFALIVGSAASLASLLAHGMIDNSIFVIDLAYIFMLLIAVLANNGAIDERSQKMV
jgi:O-antigen ligase